jgi:Holliday junction resolvase RusA-like endonuclease
MFEMRCNPPKATSQQKGVMVIAGKPRYFKRKHVKRAEDDLTAMLMPHRPAKPLQGPLRVCVRWTYAWRKSESRRNMARGLIPCDTRPDCDNLCKILFDAMTRLGFWGDDSQIADLRFVKCWGDVAGIGVMADEIWKSADAIQTTTGKPIDKMNLGF